MKKITLITFLVLGAGLVSAQYKFEPGYLISNDGQRMACEIKDMDWKSNPKSFEYRSVGGTESKTESMENVAEFGITGGSTYRRHTVNIDRSTDLVERLDGNRNPVFARETLFLRLLIDGKATLYQYEDGNLLRFFYSVEQSPVQQLVYKRYLVGESGGQAGQNDLYKQQILNELKCASITKSDIERISYLRDDLMKLFQKFNECHGESVATNEVVKQPGKVNLRIRPGLTYNSFKYSSSVQNVDFGSSASFRIGFEIETVLPSNKGLWAIVVEPAYQSYSSKSGSVTIDYKSIDMGIIVRRYLPVAGENKLYASLGLVYGLPLSADTAIKYPAFTLKVSSGINVTLGVGYIMNRFSAEINYAFKRGIMGDYSLYTSNYSGPAFILGYRVSK